MEFLDLTMTDVFLEHQSYIYLFTFFGSKAPNKADFRVENNPAVIWKRQQGALWCNFTNWASPKQAFESKPVGVVNHGFCI